MLRHPPTLVRHAVVLVPLFVLAACGSTEETTAPSGTADVTLDDLLEAGARTDADAALPAVLQRLGPPQRVHRHPVENEHVAGQIDTIRTYTYDGLRLRTYDVAASSKVLLIGLVVTNGRYQTEDGLRVGTSREAVEARRGEPSDVRDDTYVYQLSEVAPDWLYVRFEDDTVAELEWDLYYD